MYSMKRTSAGARRPNSIRSASSSSLTPRMTTVSIFVPVKPARATEAMPSSTWACVFRRVSAAKRSGRSVSRLTVTRWRPASFSAAACSASSTPLVVMARSRSPGLAASSRISRATSRRSSGSPPVSRTLSTPSSMKTSISRLISSKCRISSRGSQTYSSSGMQYAQRRLHRSVTEIRRFRSARPKTSVAGAIRPPPRAPARPTPARSHSRSRPAFFTPTSKWSHGIRSSVGRTRVV